jgi:hypothetical protein
MLPFLHQFRAPKNGSNYRVVALENMVVFAYLIGLGIRVADPEFFPAGPYPDRHPNQLPVVSAVSMDI